MLYVRKKPKGFGRGAQIEGDMKPGCRCLLVEDLATDGGSKVNFVNAIREAEGQVKDAFVVFHYGIFPQSVETLAKLGVRLHGLATWRDMLAAAEANTGWLQPTPRTCAPSSTIPKAGRPPMAARLSNRLFFTFFPSWLPR